MQHAGGAVAEGVFEGILGGEAEAPATESDVESRVSADAFAAALAADHAKYDPAVARAAERFLERQAHLLELEAVELQEQRAVRLHHLHDQTRESQLRRFAQHMRNGLQIFVAILATAIGLGLVIMLADAFSARSVVVEPFDAPPALAARGLTGKVVAGEVLDALTKLQAATRSSAAKRRLSNAWTGDIKVEVPETGISLSDIFHALVARFGHETHIDGDLVQTGDGGLVLTIRGDGILPRSFQGAAGDLDTLTTQAAEYAYGQSQPGLYAGYLMNGGRNADAVAFAKTAYPTASELDKPEVLNVWADAWQNLGATPKEALPLYREAIRQKPDFWTGYANIMNLDLDSGKEEDVWRLGRQMVRLAGGRPGRADDTDYQNFDLVTWNLAALRESTLADIAAHGGIGTGVLTETPVVADIDQRLHDFADAELQLQTGLAVANDPSVAALTHFVHGRIAAQTGD
ncbi:MAG TPA: hypothetical protein VHX64_01910, partial [Caulobacteraceae bacterium]|nr:hypothetical protein [Caulobacteraceae bacterium]